MADIGITVSKPGYDLKRAIITGGGVTMPIAPWLVYNSSWILYKIVQTGTISMSIASTSGTARLDSSTVIHTQPLTPMVSMYFSIDGGTTWYGNNGSSTGSSGSPEQRVWISSSATNIEVNAYSENMAAYTLLARYVIYADQGA